MSHLLFLAFLKEYLHEIHRQNKDLNQQYVNMPKFSLGY